jgi:hypothetical protein
MEVRPGRVESLFNAQWHTARKLRRELRYHQELVRAAFEDGEMLRDVEAHGGRGGKI